MAEVCRGVVPENEVPSSVGANSRAARQKRRDIRRVKFLRRRQAIATGTGFKKPRASISPASFGRGCDNVNAVVSSSYFKSKSENDDKEGVGVEAGTALLTSAGRLGSDRFHYGEVLPKFGVASVCGWRREMEDAVAIHPSFSTINLNQTANLHFYGVYDGHGCSHVARRCKDRLHLLVAEELNRKMKPIEWKKTMERSFRRMDEEVMIWNQQATGGDCRCELQTPECYGVGSTAVVAVVAPDKIVVANCGDSRAVLCRNGKAVPLSNDHKSDRPDELNRIQAIGGEVLYWGGSRVSGGLAMSRSIGDNYLKPYVSCEPEVTITDRTKDDECLILASDGLWDVVSSDTACGLARMCLKRDGPSTEMKGPPESDVSGYENCDMGCSNASLLLTKLGLARRSGDNVSVVVVDLSKNGSL